MELQEQINKMQQEIKDLQNQVLTLTKLRNYYSLSDFTILRGITLYADQASAVESALYTLSADYDYEIIKQKNELGETICYYHLDIFNMIFEKEEE